MLSQVLVDTTDTVPPGQAATQSLVTRLVHFGAVQEATHWVGVSKRSV